MRNLAMVLALGIPVLAVAQDRRCVVSFDAAQIDVCSGEAQLVNRDLAALADPASFQDSPIRVVKFEGPISAGQRAALQAAGAEILGYAPYHAYLVRMQPELDASVRGLPGVVWSGPFLPIWKLDINLVRDLQGARIVEQAGIERLTVALHPGVDSEAMRAPLQGLDGARLDFSERGHDHERLVLTFDHDRLGALASELASRPEIASVSLRWDNELMNSQAGWLHQSGVQNQRPIFDRGIYGCGQVVAAADSGLHATHCSFSDTAVGTPAVSVCNTGATCPPGTPNFDHRKIGLHYKWSGTAGSLPADDHGHGTHVMGSLTGNNPAGAVDCATLTTPGGNSDLDGTAPGAKLISQEMGGSLQYLNTLGGTIYHAASIAFGHGARVHNNSWGSGCRTSIGSCIAGCQVEYRATTRDADAVVWDFPELAVMVAAGNSGGSPGSSGCGAGADVGAPGNAKNVFSIGSNLRGTGGNGMSGFSSRGPTSDRRSKPDMTAQGSSIISASRTVCGTVSNSGTSMASPTAAGLAALVRDYLARGYYPFGTAQAANAITNP